MGRSQTAQRMKKPRSFLTSVFVGSKSTPGRIRTSNPRFRRPREPSFGFDNALKKLVFTRLFVQPLFDNASTKCSFCELVGRLDGVPTESKLLGMTAGLVEEEINSEEETTCTQTIELLQANKGSQCSIVLDDGTVLAGKIGKALVNESMQASSANDHLNIRPIYGEKP